MGMKKIRIVEAILAISFVIALYFLSPYILPVFGAKSFVIVSESMRHYEKEVNQSFFESFWKDMGVEPEDLSFRYGLLMGDLAVIAPSENYSVGDVVVFKIPGKDHTTLHRIYKINSTHFRDIGDKSINEERFEKVRLAVKGVDVFVFTEDSLLEPDLVYEGPSLETSTHYWMPVSYIEGKVSVALPQAGMLYFLLEGSPFPEN
jgi:hypothetical protein